MHSSCLVSRVVWVLATSWLVLTPPEAVASKWIRLRFDDITVIANTGEREAAGYARQIGNLRRSLRSYDMVEAVQERPAYLYLFRNRESFEPYLPLRDGKPAWIGGYTTSSIAGVFMALDVTAAERPMHIVYHEYVHAYLRQHAPRMPLWLEEGLAEFYGAFRMDGNTAVIGEPIAHHVNLLTGSRPMSRGKLLMVDQNDPSYNEGLRQSFFYAQSWANVHYLLTDKTRRAALRSFLERIHAGERIMPTLRETLDDHMPDQHTELIAYATQRKLPHFRIERKDDDASQRYEVESIDDADVYASLGLLLVHFSKDRPGAAEAYFQRALDEDPGQLDARMGRAILWSIEEKPEEAKQELLGILEDHPDHSLARIFLARLLNIQYRESIENTPYQPAAETPAMLAEARRQMEYVLERNPNDAAALGQYGLTFYADEDPSAGIEALTRACQAIPWDGWYTNALVELHCHAKNVDQARAIYDRDIEPRTRAAERKQIATVLVQAELEAARERSEAGDLEGALLILTRSAEGTGDAGLRKTIHRALGRTTASVEIQRLNDAIDTYRDGDVEAALVALDELIPQLEFESVRARAEELRDQMRAELGRD